MMKRIRHIYLRFIEKVFTQYAQKLNINIVHNKQMLILHKKNIVLRITLLDKSIKYWYNINYFRMYFLTNVIKKYAF
mgnify:FL=1